VRVEYDGGGWSGVGGVVVAEGGTTRKGRWNPVLQWMQANYSGEAATSSTQDSKPTCVRAGWLKKWTRRSWWVFLIARNWARYGCEEGLVGPTWLEVIKGRRIRIASIRISILLDWKKIGVKNLRGGWKVKSEPDLPNKSLLFLWRSVAYSLEQTWWQRWESSTPAIQTLKKREHQY